MEAFEGISFNVLSYIRRLPGVSDLNFQPRAGATAEELNTWQSTHATFSLPEDLLGFFEISNGLAVTVVGNPRVFGHPPALTHAFLSVVVCVYVGGRATWHQWKAQSPQASIHVGSFALNALSDLTRLPVDSLQPLARGDMDPNKPRRLVSGARHLPDACAAFLLEQHPRVGQVALVFALNGLRPRADCSGGGSSPGGSGLGLGSGGGGSSPAGCTPGRPERPEFAGVWFCDQERTWHFLADSFTAYYRLLIVHLGILGWQYAYTPQGLDPLTTQWMRLYCPQRLMLDLQHSQDAQPPLNLASRPNSANPDTLSDRS